VAVSPEEAIKLRSREKILAAALRLSQIKRFILVHAARCDNITQFIINYNKNIDLFGYTWNVNLKRETTMNVFHYDGLFGLIILILDIWAIVNVVASSNGVLSKVIWVLIILLLPILGFLIWLIFGPRRPRI